MAAPRVGSGTISFSRPVVLSLALALVVGGAVADSPPKDQDGGFTLTVSFDYASLVESTYLDPNGGFSEQRYCDIFANASHHLWQITEGTHWIKRVDFRLGVQSTDINWYFAPAYETSYAQFNNAIIYQENTSDPDSPRNNRPGDPGYDPIALADFDDRQAWRVDHELGHFIYGLSDEYVHGRSNGTLGICSGFSGGTCLADPAIACLKDAVCDAANMGDTCSSYTSKEACDEDADCLNGEDCIFYERRTGEPGEPSKICNDHTDDDPPGSFTTCDDDQMCQGLEDPLGNPAACVADLVVNHCAGLGANPPYCWTDDDCQQGGNQGWCVREGQGAQPSLTPLCRDRNAPYPAMVEPDIDDFRNRTSNMASSGAGGRWCDATTHVHQRTILRGKTGTFTEDGMAGVDPDFKLTLDPSYNSWQRAVDQTGEYLGDLDSYFANRVDYPMWVDLERPDFESAVDFPNEFVCAWNIDDIPLPGDNTMIVVDKSGSMDYTVGLTGKTAFESAAEGALMVMEETDAANWVGILAFAGNLGADTTTLIQPFAERLGINVPDDPFDSFFAGVAPGGATDIGQAIQDAAAEMAGQGPTGNRNIILMSDGANTVFDGPDPLAEAAAACDAGIVIDTIAFGEADTTALKDLADACDGMALAAGTEEVLVEGVDPHLLKTEFARMKYLIGGLDEIFSDPLGTLSDQQDVISRTFYVPVDSGPLTFTWIGNEVPFCAEYASGEICIDERDAWSELAFEVESPGAQITPGAQGKSFHAVAKVADPEPGWWIARVDATAVPVVQNYVIREATRVSWLADIAHPDLLARAWIDEWKQPLDHPVLIHASLYFKAPLTKIAVVAHVTKGGVAYAPFALFDDGQHDDHEAADGVYGGYFNPDGNFFTTEGAYKVRVEFLALEGISRAVTTEPRDDDSDVPPLQAPSAVAAAETLFHLWPRFDCGSALCPPPGTLNLPLGIVQQGQGSIPRMTAQVTELPLLDGRVSLDLGPGVRADNLQVVSRNVDPGQPQQGELMFDVFVENRARVGPHVATVSVGSRSATASFDVSCGAVDLAPPLIDAPRASYVTCGETIDLLVPFPPAVDECSVGAPVDVTGVVESINGQPIVPPTPINATAPVTLPLGHAIVRWTASDVVANTTTRRQRIEIELDPACRAAGRVPDGAASGVPLLLNRLATGEIELSWGDSCGVGDTDYEIYSGTLGGFGGPTPLTCSTSGATAWVLGEDPGDRYYLVVPRTPVREGSYGLDGEDFERPPAAGSCLRQELGVCLPV